VSRKALLLALDDYQDALKLEAPRNDAAMLEKTLGRLGYRSDDIAVHCSSRERALTTYRIRNLVRAFFSTAQDGDELLLYVSGHGVDQDGGRLIVPVDYDCDDPPPPSELLSDYWLYGNARGSAAASVLILLDTCREAVRLKLDAVAKGTDLPAEEPRSETAPTIAIVYSCEPGRRSWATKGNEGVSFFTEAVCYVLENDERVATLSTLLEAATRRLCETAPAGRTQVPFLDERNSATGRSGTALNLVVKEDRAARLRQQIAVSRWSKLMESAPLWAVVESAPEGLRLQLRVLAARSEVLVRQAGDALPQDRWRTESALVRVLRAVPHLVPTGSVQVAEAALYLAVPFVYEAIMAGLIVRIAQTGPVLSAAVDSDVHGWTAVPARAWSRALEGEEEWARRRDHLERTGQSDAALDVHVWQLWSFAHRAGELWTFAEGQRPGASGWLNDLLSETLSPAPFAEVAQDSRVTELLNGRRLVRLARLLFADLDDIESEAAKNPGGLSRDQTFGYGTALWRIDEVEIAHVLSLAGAIALDARRLPETVTEHLGVDPGFEVPSVQAALERAQWQRDERLVLALSTPFPAVHAALTTVVAKLERHRHGLQISRILSARTAALLPTAILDTKLQPEIGPDDRPVFDPRHLQFTLDQQRVIRLLMGEALYSEPSRALRELYQNALDACRYRRARETLLRQQRDTAEPYLGSIRLESGLENGRPYIVCEDDGIGMTERHLRELFARAGRRFTDSHEFHLDRAQWEEKGVQFWPNSRFGIGVLSYFMLAEELAIETRRVESHGGVAPEGLVVRVTGAGSLFRIRHDPAIRRTGGTRLTLYLKDMALAPGDLLDTVRSWLLMPEVDTTLRRSNGQQALLRAGELTVAGHAQFGSVLAVSATANSLGQPRAFWTVDYWENQQQHAGQRMEGGGILLDGVRTASDQAPAAILVNLSEDIAGTPSIDRERVNAPPALKSWLIDRFIEDRGETLLGACASSARLAQLSQAQPELLIDLDDRLRDGELKLHDTALEWIGPATRPTAGLGLSVADIALSALFSARPFWNSLPEVLVSVRLAELADHSTSLPDIVESFVAYRCPTLPVRSLPLAPQRVLAPPSMPARLRARNYPLRASDFIQVRKRLGLEMSAVTELAQPLEELGLIDADLEALRRWDSLHSTIRDALDARLEVSVQTLLAMTVEEDVTPAEIAERARPLVQLGLVAVDLERFADLSEISALTLRFLQTSFEKYGMEIAGVILALRRGDAESRQMPDLERALKILRVIDENSDASNLCTLHPLSGALLSRDLDGRAPFLEYISDAHLVMASQTLNIPLQTACEILRPLVERRLVESSVEVNISPEIEDFVRRAMSSARLSRYSDGLDVDDAVSPDFISTIVRLRMLALKAGKLNELEQRWTSYTSRVLSVDIDGMGPFLDVIDIGHLWKAVLVLDQAPKVVAIAVAALDQLGLVKGDLEKFANRKKPDATMRALLSRDFDAAPPWRTALSAFDLVAASMLLKRPLPELFRYLDDLELCGVNVEDARAFAVFSENRIRTMPQA
jgi:uncharacterized caspase-like protein